MIILKHRFLLTNQGKLFKNTPWFVFCLFLFMYLIDLFVKSLPWGVDIHGSKISFYLNIQVIKA